MSVDPWAFQRWAYETSTGSAGRKSILVALSVMADTTTGRCEAKVATLAQQCEMGDRTVRTHLAALEEAGLVTRRPQFRLDGGRRGDEYLLRAPWVEEWPDGAPLPDRPGGSGEDGSGASHQDGERASPKAAEGASPQTAAQEQPPRGTASGNGRPARGDEDPKKMIPEDFPDELRPHARAVLPLLRSVAVQHNSKEVLPLALARVMMAPERRRKPFVKAAHDFAAWAVDPPRPIKDVVASYRTWLDREKNLQAIERLADAPRDVGDDDAGSSRRYSRED